MGALDHPRIKLLDLPTHVCSFPHPRCRGTVLVWGLMIFLLMYVFPSLAGRKNKCPTQCKIVRGEHLFLEVLIDSSHNAHF